MKRIFLIVSILISSLISFGQFGGVTPLGGTSNTISEPPGAIRGKIATLLTVYSDTVTASNGKTNYYGGSAFYNSTTQSIWYHNANKWIEISPVTAQCQLSLVGAAIWSTVGYIYNVTATTYNFPQSTCTFYHTTPTPITLAAADPSQDRQDVIYVDITQNVGRITGTPGSGLPPVVDPFSQRIVAIVSVPAGSTSPSGGGGTASTIVYNENVEWSGTSTVSGANFSYGTNPYIGSVSALFPTPTDGSSVTWQNGSQLNIGNYQYFPFHLRLNSAPIGNPPALLTVTFYNGTTQVTAPVQVGNGMYGCNYATLNAYQEIDIPINAPFNGTPFDRVKITFIGAPTLQIDYAYLLQNNPTPPQQNFQWNVTGLNDITGLTNAGIGTSSPHTFNVYTGGHLLAKFPVGWSIRSDTALRNVKYNPADSTFYLDYTPTIRAVTPLVIVDSSDTHSYITCPTCGSGTAYTASQGVELLGNNIQLHDSFPNGFGTAARFMWVPSKKAIRAGSASSTRWDYDSLGTNSAAFGLNTKAVGSNSFAAGTSANAVGSGSVAFSGTANGTNSFAMNGTATGSNSFAFHGTASNAGIAIGGIASGLNTIAIGNNNITASGISAIAIGTKQFSIAAQGDESVAIGYDAVAKARGGITLGVYNDTTDTPNPSVYDPSDRIFQIANGQENAFPASPTLKNAMTVFRSGSTQLNQYGTGTFTGTPTYSLSVDATGHLIETTPSAPFTGDANALVYTDGSGNLTTNSLNSFDGNTLQVLNDNGALQVGQSVGDGYAGIGLVSGNGFIQISNTAGATTFTVDPVTGFVGIGVIPTEKLHLRDGNFLIDDALGSVFARIGINGNNVFGDPDGTASGYKYGVDQGDGFFVNAPSVFTGALDVAGAIQVQSGTSGNVISGSGLTELGEVGADTYIDILGSTVGNEIDLYGVTKVIGLAGTGTRIVTADPSGTLGVTNSGLITTSRLTGQTAAATLATYTVGASDASYMVSANILVTTATLHSFNGRVTYTSEDNVSRTVVLNFSTLAGALTPTITNTVGAAPYEGVPLQIRCKAGTTIVFSTAGTFTTVVYNFERSITQLN